MKQDKAENQKRYTVPWLEIRRKIMHIYPLALPIAYHYVSKETALTVLIPTFTCYIFCDVFRHVHKGFKRLFDRIITTRFLR